jgi:flagellar hook-associated protein 1 FlgK
VRVATPPVPLAAYQLRMATASTYEIVDPATSAVVGSGPYVAGDWIEVDGIEFQLSAGAGAGDSFALTRDPDGVPTPYASAAAGSNSGTASVDSRVAAAPVPLAAYDVRVVELAGVTSYEVLQAGTTTVLGSGPYVSSSWVGIDGLEFQLTGVPKVGDSFTVARNVDGAADNANIRDLVGLRLPEGGGFEQRYERQVTSLAAALANTKSLAEASKALRDSTVASRDSVMAVNLDREAADLLRYQQAYQACSKIISAAQTLFDTLVRL